MNGANLPLLYSVGDAAKALEVSPGTIRDRARVYGVGAKTIGGTLVFTAADLEQLKQPTGKRGNPTFGKSS